MAGYSAVLMVDRLREQASTLGFRLCFPKHSYDSGQRGDSVSIIPKDDESLPMYSRDAEIFTGTLEELKVFFRGLEWARQYDDMLKLSNNKKRSEKEQNIRNQQLCQILKNEEIDRIEF